MNERHLSCTSLSKSTLGCVKQKIPQVPNFERRSVAGRTVTLFRQTRITKQFHVPVAPSCLDCCTPPWRSCRTSSWQARAQEEVPAFITSTMVTDHRSFSRSRSDGDAPTPMTEPSMTSTPTTFFTPSSPDVTTQPSSRNTGGLLSPPSFTNATTPTPSGVSLDLVDSDHYEDHCDKAVDHDHLSTASPSSTQGTAFSESSSSVSTGTTVKNLFNKAYEYLNPGRAFRSVVYLYAERKLMVFFLTHFACTMIIWCKFV